MALRRSAVIKRRKHKCIGTPDGPSEAERERHELTKLPSSSIIIQCAMAEGREGPHARWPAQRDTGPSGGDGLRESETRRSRRVHGAW